MVSSSKFLGCALSLSLGCAYAETAPATTTPATTSVDPSTAAARRDNEVLKRRMELLEDRVLRLENELALARGEPPVSPPQARPSRARRARSVSLAEPNSPTTTATKSKSIKLDAASPDPTLADPRLWDDPAGLGSSIEGDDGLASAPASSAEREPEPEPVMAARADERSFRLVGSELVEATQAPPAQITAPERSKRKAKSIKGRYANALAMYRAGQYAQAQLEFDALAREFPKSDYADNALYWKGESAYDQQHFSDALAAFTEVVERYGGGNKAPDALLKIGLCFDKLGDRDNASDVLTQLVAAYPGAAASDIARARLAEFEVQS